MAFILATFIYIIVWFVLRFQILSFAVFKFIFIRESELDNICTNVAHKIKVVYGDESKISGLMFIFDQQTRSKTLHYGLLTLSLEPV